MLPALILAIFLTCGQCERNYLVEVKDKPADNFGNKITEDEVIIDERRPAGYMENKITEDEVLYGDELDHHKSKKKTKPLIDELDHHHKNKASTDKKLKKRKQKKGRNGEDYTVEKFKQGVELAKEGLALGKKALGFVQGLGRR